MSVIVFASLNFLLSNLVFLNVLCLSVPLLIFAFERSAFAPYALERSAFELFAFELSASGFERVAFQLSAFDCFVLL